MSESDNREEWKMHYAVVRRMCERYGREDASGCGDFWVSDDNWGGVTQRIIVHSPTFLRPKLVRELVEYLRSNEYYGVMIEVIIDLNFEDQKLPPMMGLVIDMQSGEEHWDLPAIRQKIGNFFTRTARRFDYPSVKQQVEQRRTDPNQIAKTRTFKASKNPPAQ